MWYSIDIETNNLLDYLNKLNDKGVRGADIKIIHEWSGTYSTVYYCSVRGEISQYDYTNE